MLCLAEALPATCIGLEAFDHECTMLLELLLPKVKACDSILLMLNYSSHREAVFKQTMSQGLESPKAEVLLERLRDYVSEQGTHFLYTCS